MQRNECPQKTDEVDTVTEAGKNFAGYQAPSRRARADSVATGERAGRNKLVRDHKRRWYLRAGVEKRVEWVGQRNGACKPGSEDQQEIDRLMGASGVWEGMTRSGPSLRAC